MWGIGGNWSACSLKSPCLHTGFFHPSLFSVIAFCDEELEDFSKKGAKAEMQYKKIDNRVIAVYKDEFSFFLNQNKMKTLFCVSIEFTIFY